MTKHPFRTPSTDGIHTLAGTVYLPDCEPKGAFHVVHGMAEHIGRYDRFLGDMANEGYLCFGYDNLGHGHTARTPDELGYIAPKNGYDLLARDVKKFADAVLAEYAADRPLPYYLMGHSMGSFITRYAVAHYVTPAKYIIMGTGGQNPAADAGLAVIALLQRRHGDRYLSPLVDRLAFGSYNDRFGGGTPEDPSPWLTNDRTEREKYYADPLCGFPFTVSAMGDLIRLNKLTNNKTWYHNFPKDLPVLLISGKDDPVGNYGKGVLQVRDRLKNHGVSADVILYPGARHEILNDRTYTQTKSDILAFLTK